MKILNFINNDPDFLGLGTNVNVQYVTDLISGPQDVEFTVMDIKTVFNGVEQPGVPDVLVQGDDVSDFGFLFQKIKYDVPIFKAFAEQFGLALAVINLPTGDIEYLIYVVNFVTDSPLPDGQLANAYSETLTVTGGVGPYAYSLFEGDLPLGLSLDLIGNITGTPTSAGTSTFTVEVVDANNNIGRKEFSLTIIE